MVYFFKEFKVYLVVIWILLALSTKTESTPYIDTNNVSGNVKGSFEIKSPDDRNILSQFLKDVFHRKAQVYNVHPNLLSLLLQKAKSKLQIELTTATANYHVTRKSKQGVEELRNAVENYANITRQNIRDLDQDAPSFRELDNAYKFSSKIYLTTTTPFGFHGTDHFHRSSMERHHHGSMKVDKGKNIIKFVASKVEQLKPYLEDDSVPSEDQLTLQGEDDTTIIEFVPHLKSNSRAKLLEEKTNQLKHNIDKYKKMRNKIKRAMKREHVTNRTKHLVTRTLDDMMTEIIDHKCKSQGDKATIKAKMSVRNKDHKGPKEVIEQWNHLWQKLKTQYMHNKSHEYTDPREIKMKNAFLEKFQDLVSLMTNELYATVNQYNVRCELKRKDEPEVLRNKPKARIDKIVRDSSYKFKGLKDGKDKKICDNFKLCTLELKDYLYGYYLGLTESAVSTIRNYAAMFLRDVSDDGYHEKERVVALINETAEEIEKNVDYIYRKQTLKLNLGEKKDQLTNIKDLYRYVKKTIDEVKKNTHKSIEIGLVSVRQKLMENIQKDIDVNLNLEMLALERTMLSRVCPNFETCNGRAFQARRTNIVGNNNVYVKVELDLDDDNTDQSSAKRTPDSIPILSKPPKKVNVTRTTPSIQLLVSYPNTTFVETEKEATNITEVKVNEDGMILAPFPEDIEDEKLNVLEENPEENNKIVEPYLTLQRQDRHDKIKSLQREFESKEKEKQLQMEKDLREKKNNEQIQRPPAKRKSKQFRRNNIEDVTKTTKSRLLYIGVMNDNENEKSQDTGSTIAVYK